MKLDLTDLNANIKATSSMGYHIKFPNGLVLSVQWGPCTYSDNYNANWAGMNLKSETAEVAVMDESGNFVTNQFIPGDDVAGWQTVDQVLDLIKALLTHEA